jgi:RNA polymerase-binding protein DksA
MAAPAQREDRMTTLTSARPGARTLPHDSLDYISQALEDDLVAQRRTLAEHVAALDRCNEDDHADGETRRHLLGAIQRAQDAVTEIAAAIARLEAGTYGVCGECGDDIGAPRLEVLPTARRCIRCAATGPSA